MNRNINISYLLAFAKNSWFWLGIWVFYYLRFTNYAGIGIIETVLITTMTLTEIPTGAIADLFGKKKTLILGFLLEAVGGFLMAFAPNFQMIVLSVFIMCIGGSFYSGTLDALVFDTLKESGKTEKFDKVISNINSIYLIAPAICSVIGGFLYAKDPRLPFILNAVGYTFGFIVCFFLSEPHIDTIKFSFKNYLKQTGQGLAQLFKTTEIRVQTILLLSIGFVVVISSEMVDSFLSFEFGFTDKQMGILWSVIFIMSALFSQLTPRIKKVFGTKNAVILASAVMIISYLVSPFVGIIFGGISLIIRSSMQATYWNLSSIIINNNTESNYRATTLSTFNMIKNMPYVLGAYFIGRISDLFSAKTVSLYLGLALLVFIIIQSIQWIFTVKKSAIIASK